MYWMGMVFFEEAGKTELFSCGRDGIQWRTEKAMAKSLKAVRRVILNFDLC